MNTQNRKRLIEALAQEDAKKYPNVPAHCRANRLMNDNSANGLTKCVVAYLNAIGYQAERISNQGQYRDTSKEVTDILGRKMRIGSGTWTKGSGTNGTADISATIRGRSVKIEVKFGTDRQSEAQRVYQANIEQAGGIYWIVRTFDDFMVKFDNFIANE